MKAKQTGPKSVSGKAVASMNAVKTGLHVSGWLDADEQLEYETLFDQLCQEYSALAPTMLIQIERMASTIVKMRRLQKIEAALFLKARQLAQRQTQERLNHQDPSATDEVNLAALNEFAAMPEMERLASLQRYQTSLDRQLSKIIGEIKILHSTNALPKPAIQNRSTILHQEGTQIISTIDDEPSNSIRQQR